MEQYISVPSGALAALHAQDFKAYALLRQVAEFPQPGVPLSVAAAQANLPFTTLLASMAVLRLRGYLVVLPDIDSLSELFDRGDALAGRGVDLSEGPADVERLAIGGDAEGLDAVVGGGPQGHPLTVGGPDRTDAPRSLVVQRRELPAQVEGLAVGGGGDRVDGGVGGGSPVEDLSSVDVVGHRVAARRLVLAGRRACGPDRGELSDGVDDVAHHDLIPDDAVDLGGGQGVGGDGARSAGSAGGGRVRGGGCCRGKSDGAKGDKSRSQEAAQKSAGELHRYSIQNIRRSRTHNLTSGW